MAENGQVSLPDDSGGAEGAGGPASVRKLINAHGRTFAEEAGIALANEPGPLWQLLVLANLLSARIRSDAALSSARELWKIGCDTPGGSRATSWQQRVDALGRGGYRRYDFSTATRIGANAKVIAQHWNDDLRQVLQEAVTSPGQSQLGTTHDGSRVQANEFSAGEIQERVAKSLQKFDGIGPAGSRIVLREVQGVWPQVGICVDPLVCKGAEKMKIPDIEGVLADLTPQERPRLCAALVRVSRGK